MLRAIIFVLSEKSLCYMKRFVIKSVCEHRVGQITRGDHISVIGSHRDQRTREREGINMVKHVILWTLKEEYSGAEMDVIRDGIKAGLEGLRGQIPGLVDIEVNIKPLGSSNCDLMLDSTFKDEASLKAYSVHPAHVEVANTKVRPFTASRVCIDYEI